MNVFLTGGGTMGPVTPLLAIVEAWRKRRTDVEFVWIGTPNGPERAFVERYQIPFYALPVARIPRYISIEWLTFPFTFLFAFLKSLYLIARLHPDVIASAGGFTSVPVVLAGKLFRVPSWLHQQDVYPILTSLLLAPFVHQITVAFEQSYNIFQPEKTQLLGNPVRPSILDGSKTEAMKLFALSPHKPTLLVFGGGTGATWINHAMEEIAGELVSQMNVIHVTGKGKKTNLESLTGYFQTEFLYESLKHVYAVSDLVVSRAGMGSITELSALSKPTIFVPLPNSAQEVNLDPFLECVSVVEQHQSHEVLKQTILDLMKDSEKRQTMGQLFHDRLQTDVAHRMIELLEQMIKK